MTQLRLPVLSHLSDVLAIKAENTFRYVEVRCEEKHIRRAPVSSDLIKSDISPTPSCTPNGTQNFCTKERGNRSGLSERVEKEMEQAP